MQHFFRMTLLLLLGVAGGLRPAWAQTSTISGRVTSAEDGAGLPGVSVIVKGTTRGTATNAEGRYQLEAAPADVLQFKGIGYATQERPVGESKEINVGLRTDNKQLGEVVVTALGLEQEKRSVNYAAQQIGGDDLRQSRETNVVNAINSKVAGVQIVSQAGTAGAAASINIRGKSGFGGSSQPLFVVDGIPISNSFTTTASASSVDTPNRAIDINPDDIESLTVLKGPAAAALYGIQGGNGVVLITTKRGSKSDVKTTSVEFNNSYSLDRINRQFQLQDQFAQGNNGVFSDAQTVTPIWGAPFSSLRYSNTPSPLSRLGQIVPATDPTAIQDRPVVPFDNQAAFWQTGHTLNNHVALTSGNRDQSFYFSVGNLAQTGIIPLNSFRRTTIKLSGASQITDKFRVSGSASYISSGGRRVGRGDNFTGVTQGLYRTPRNFDILNGLDRDDPAAWRFPNGSQRNYRNRSQLNGPTDNFGPDGPLWTVNENPYNDKVDRLIGSTELNYKLTPWLSALYRAGADVYSDRRTHFFNIGTFGADGRGGGMFEQTIIEKTYNSDFILTANKNITPDLNLTALVGHNYFATSRTETFIAGSIFIQPDFFNIANATNITPPFQSLIRRRTAAAYGSLKLDYKSWAYLEATGRNEWVSMLPVGNNSFFFPSLSGGLVFSELLPKSNAFTFGKLKGSIAQVANGPGPYADQTFYLRTSAVNGFGTGVSFPLPSGVAGLSLSNSLGNPALRPQFNTTWEVGAELRFLQDKVSLDVTYYNSLSTNQFLNREVARSSGFAGQLINGGRIRNRGIEAIVGLTPVRNEAFRWDMTFNFTRNRNVVEEIPGDLTQLFLDGFGTIFQPRLVEGQQYGVFYGSAWLRNDQGQRLIGADGFPLRDPVLRLIGNPNPNYLLGIRNTFNYKGVNLSFLIDIREGGDVWNGTEAVLTNVGATVRTAQRGQQVVFDGVRQSDGQPNTQLVTLTQPWFNGGNGSATGAAGVHEQFVEDGSWVRLRDASLGYSLPAKWLGGGFVKRVDLSVFGRNLLLLTNYSGIDPETNFFGLNSASAGLDYFGNPNTRSLGVSLNAKF